MWIVKRIIALIIVIYGCTGAELAKQTSITPGTKTCRAPSQPQNGHWKLHRSQCESRQECDISEGTELPAGSHLIYSCNPGSKIRGSSDVSCSFEGEWLNVPVCTETRCKPLSTVSTEARCSYLDEWVSCDSPVLPKTRARLSCRNSYRPETSLLSRQRENVRCGENGQWEPEPIRCIPGPLRMNIYINDIKLTLHVTLDRNKATFIEVLENKVIIYMNGRDPSYPNIDIR